MRGPHTTPSWHYSERSRALMNSLSVSRSPQRVNRYARRNNQQSGPGVLRLVAQQLHLNEQREQEINRGKQWVAEHSIRAFDVWTPYAQHEESSDSQDVEHHHREDHEIEQLPVRTGEA